MNTRPLRDKFYIITNGKETEYNYFTLLKQKKSVYEVLVEFQNEDPLGLVEYACRYKGEANQIWVVFDIDYSYQDGRLIPAINKADKENIKYAFSNIAFEVWLLSHFEQCSKQMSTAQHQQALSAYLGQLKQDTIYDKTSKDQLKEFFIPRYTSAIENAKIVYQKKLANHIEKCGENSKPPIWEWNSSTNVYKLVEALKLTTK